MVEAYLGLVPLLQVTDQPPVDAFEGYFAFAMGFNYAFDDAKLVPLAKYVYTNFISVSFAMDRWLASQRKTPDRVKAACNALDALRGKMIDRLPFPNSRKAGIVFVANLIFKCYLKLNNLSQLQKVLDYVFNHVLQDDSLLDLHFSASERTTFYFYMGKFHLLQHDIVNAKLKLEKSFGLCHKQHLKNKRTILIYLTASKMLLGQFPLKTGTLYPLLERFDVAPQYSPLIDFLKQGNIGAFINTLDTNPHREFFLRHHIYNVLRWRSQLVLYRNLLKRVFIIGSSIPTSLTNGYSPLTNSPVITASVFGVSTSSATSSLDNSQPHRISFRDVITGLQVSGDPLFIDRIKTPSSLFTETALDKENFAKAGWKAEEVALNVAVIGLISRLAEVGLVKGQIVPSNSCIVVSKKSPMPPLFAVLSKQEVTPAAAIEAMAEDDD
eukprot:Partr_v1_DN28805_c2_g1_i1_m33002 putative PCI domain containing 2